MCRLYAEGAFSLHDPCALLCTSESFAYSCVCQKLQLCSLHRSVGYGQKHHRAVQCYVARC
jgi:hypothetical protein